MRFTKSAASELVIILAFTQTLHGQCPVSVRQVLDEYPPLSEGSLTYGMPATVWDRDGEGPLRPVLAFGGAYVQGRQTSTPYTFGTMLWNGRSTKRLNERVPVGFPSSWYSIGVDPQTNRLWSSNSGSAREFDGTTWQIHEVADRFGVKQFVPWNGRLFACGLVDPPATSPLAALDAGVWSLQPPPLPITAPITHPFIIAATAHSGELVTSTESGLYAWNGNSWRSYCPDPSNIYRVTALASFQGSLWAAADAAGGPRVYRRNGNQWIELSRPVTYVSLPSKVNDLVVFDGSLFAVGDFSTVQSITRQVSLLRWTGAAWEAPGNGTAGVASALGTWQGRLCAAGPLRDDSARRLIEYNGAGWSRVGPTALDSATPQPKFFLELNGERIAGGTFRAQTGAPADYVARYDGTQWRQFGPVLPSSPLAMCVWNGAIVAAVRDPADIKTGLVLSLASPDAEWETLGRFREDGYSGSGVVTGLTTHGTELVAFGTFATVQAGGQTTQADRIAVRGPGGWESRPMSGLLSVNAVVSHESDLYAVLATKRAQGGLSTDLAKWETQPQAWRPIGDHLPVNPKQVFFISGRPCVAYTKPWGEPNSSQRGLRFFVDGSWRQLLGDTMFSTVVKVDDRTVAVGSPDLRSSVQLLRFTFSADIAGGKNDDGDGVVDSADFARFADWMMTGDLRADLGSVGGTPVGDDVLDGNDWQVFFDMYFGGCQQ